MPGFGVIPSIRVRDMKTALDFYQDALGFSLKRGGADDNNCSLDRGDAHIMLESGGDFYSPAYNDAIRARTGSKSPLALYIEASDLEGLWSELSQRPGVVVDPLADREWGQAEFTVEDPDGTWLTFWQALARD